MLIPELNQKLLAIAVGEMGVREWGSGANPTILEYFDACPDRIVRSDEVAWCSAFANWVCLLAGAKRSAKLTARSWTHEQGAVITCPEECVPGDIVVLWREQKSGWRGHVAFHCSYRDGYLYLLGGNQSNSVRVAKYPKYRFLRAIRPSPAESPLHAA